MAKKCCVPKCKSNYVSKKRRKKENDGCDGCDGDGKENAHPKNVPVYRFPSESTEKLRWISAIPLVTPEKILSLKDPVVCKHHWPENFRTATVHGKTRPVDPPSVFKPFKKSEIPTPPSNPRPTSRTSASVRTTKPDEMNAFKESDKLTWDRLKTNLSMKSRPMQNPVNTFVVGDEVQWILSDDMMNGTPRYSLRVNKDLSYDAYHIGIPCTITTLSRNRINSLDTWSKLDEALRFLHQKETTHHEEIILEQMNNMGPPKVGEKFYSPETMMRAFDYYAHSRSTYRKLRKDLKLPSERTLQKLTSKVSKLGDKSFINSVFSSLPEQQRKCIILIDEMYIKKLMLYHGGSLYGKALNNPEKMANSVFTIMVKCLNGGPSFAFKMLPVAKMDASFVFEQVKATIDMIREVEGDVKSVISDGNRTNQKFFKSFLTVPGKPWLTTDGIFLLYDYVHL